METNDAILRAQDLTGNNTESLETLKTLLNEICDSLPRHATKHVKATNILRELNK